MAGPECGRLQRGRLTSPVLVGRDRELAALTEALVQPPAIALVEGAAGVGKTRLVQEVLRHPELVPRRALVGYCQPLQEPFPLGPVVEALRSAHDAPLGDDVGAVAGALRPLVPELSDRLPPALEPLGDSRAERHRTFRAILEVLRALGPAVCVLEDLHWSDGGTVELLRFLVSQLPHELVLVLTYRREDLAPSAGLLGLASRVPAHVARAQLSVAPLDARDVRQLVRSILQVEEVSDEFALYLHERTLGLPFAVEEVLRLLADRRDLVRRHGTWARRMLEELEVPAAIRDSILERLVRLSPGARRLAQAAAVIGLPSSEELVRCVAGLPLTRTERGLSEALALGVLRESEGGRLGFPHALAAQAVYEAIAPPARRRLHLRAARELERAESPPLAQLAHHFKRADRPRRWIHYAEAAADLAFSLGNESAACELLAEALGSPAASPAIRGRLAVKLGKAALSGLDHGRALAVLRRLLDEEVLPTGVRGEVRLHVGLLLDNQAGDVAAGRAEIARAVPELRHRPGLAAQAMSVLAVPMTAEGHMAEHLGWMNRAMAAAARTSDPVLRTGVLVNRATVLMHVGDPRAWRAVLDVPRKAASPGERRQLLRASGNLAHACTCLGHYRHAEVFAADARELAAEASDPYLSVALDSTGVVLEWATGRWSGLDSRARRLSNVNEDVPRVFAEAELVLGLLLLARGKIREGKAHLRSARASAAIGGSVPVSVAAAAGLARARLLRGDAEGAAEEARETVELVRRKAIWVWAADIAPVLTESLVRSRGSPEAAEFVAELARGLRGRDAPAAHAALGVCRALLSAGEGRAGQAARSYARAERAWLDLPRPYEAARCREARALLLLSLGERRGERVLLGALEDFEQLGASWDAARVGRALRDHGLVRPWRGGRRGYGSRLSPRELEVVRLAAAGRTNREIAEALVLSPRTVEDHVAKAMRKLGVRSRRAFVAAEAQELVSD